MRGGYVLTDDKAVFDRFAGALAGLGEVLQVSGSQGTVVQLSDEHGRLFTVFDAVPKGVEWEVFQELPTPSGRRLPSLKCDDLAAFPFESRWPELVARALSAIADVVDERVWLLDGDGVLWDAGSVDPVRLRL